MALGELDSRPKPPFADRPHTKAACLVAALAFAGCVDHGASTATNSLVAICTDPAVAIPDEAFECGETHTIECASASGTPQDEIQVPIAGAPCSSVSLAVNDAGPFAVGEHTIVVTDAANNDAQVCTATLVVEDTTAPTVTAHEVALWPPNHKWHTIETDDCVTIVDDCDADVEVDFLWASSDEVVDGRGDGNHEPDIRNLSCGSVELRAERSGNESGRVYHLGWRAADDEGNVVDGVCTVRVQHDQSGRVAVDDGEAYRVEAPAECSGGGSSGGV